MQHSQANFIGGVRGVISVLYANQDSWAKNAQIEARVTSIDTKTQYASILSQDLEGIDSTISTSMLNTCLQSLVSNTLILCKKLQIFGIQTNNKPIILSTKYSISSLSKGSHEAIHNRCIAISNIAQPLLSQLQNYQVTSEELDKIHQLVQECIHLETQRTILITTRTNKNKALEELISDIRKDISLLDKMVEVYISDVNVVARYKTARTMKKYSKSKPNKSKTNKQTELVEVTK